MNVLVDKTTYYKSLPDYENYKDSYDQKSLELFVDVGIQICFSEPPSGHTKGSYHLIIVGAHGKYWQLDINENWWVDASSIKNIKLVYNLESHRYRIEAVERLDPLVFNRGEDGES